MTFRTSDGYSIRLENGEWTDGDLTFTDRDGRPADADGDWLEGEFTSGDPDHRYDLVARHYKPAGMGCYCGALSRVNHAIVTGVEKDKHALLKVPTTTHVEKVGCEFCRRLLKATVSKW